MQPKKNSKLAASASKSAQPRSVDSLTPEQKLQLKVKMQRIDKGMKSKLKDGADLSNKQTP